MIPYRPLKISVFWYLWCRCASVCLSVCSFSCFAPFPRPYFPPLIDISLVLTFSFLLLVSLSFSIPFPPPYLPLLPSPAPPPSFTFSRSSSLFPLPFSLPPPPPPQLSFTVPSPSSPPPALLSSEEILPQDPWRRDTSFCRDPYDPRFSRMVCRHQHAAVWVSTSGTRVRKF